MDNKHRWSGWPGAYCLDCGAFDPFEECVAIHDEGLYCQTCSEYLPDRDTKCTGPEHVFFCEEHVMTECPAPLFRERMKEVIEEYKGVFNRLGKE